MNIIQLLTNENITLINILSFFIVALEGLLYYKTSVVFTHLETTKKRKLLFIFTISIVDGLINLLPYNPINDILNVITFILSMILILKQTIKKSFISLILSFLIAIISAYITSVFFSTIYKLDYHSLTAIPIYYILSCLFSAMIWSVLLMIVHKFLKRKIPTIHNTPLKKTVLINILLGIVAISLESYLLFLYSDVIPMTVTLASIITLLVYFTVSIYSIVRTNALEKTKFELENEILYNKTLTLLHDNIRSFKHDFNNIVQAIGGYIALNDMEGLNKYYNKLLEECKITNNLNLLNPEAINNPSIYSLLTNKYYLATQKNINMSFSIFTDLSKINFNMYELTRILGILLDNAIEAAEETDEKLIEIEFVSNPKKQLFIIRNSCKDSNISTTKIFEKGFSTKNRNSGIGLWKVHKILSKNTNLDLFTTVKDNIFSQQLEVFY